MLSPEHSIQFVNAELEFITASRGVRVKSELTEVKPVASTVGWNHHNNIWNPVFRCYMKQRYRQLRIKVSWVLFAMLMA